MDTLKDELERAIPQIDTGNDGMELLVGAGKHAVRQRRARISGGFTAGGLVIAGLTLGVTGVLTPGGPRSGADPAVGTGPSTTQSPQRTAQPLTAELSLASLREVAGACGGVTLDPATKTLTSGGRVLDPADQVTGDGWVAFEFACGSGVIRILQHAESGVVGRYDADEGGTLAGWARANSGLAQQ